MAEHSNIFGVNNECTQMASFISGGHNHITWKMNETTDRDAVEAEIYQDLRLIRPVGSLENLRYRMSCSSIVGGLNNLIGNCRGAAIIGGSDNKMYSSSNSTIVGGNSNTINHSRDWLKFQDNALLGCVGAILTDCHHVTAIGLNHHVVQRIQDAVVMSNAIVLDKLTVGLTGTNGVISADTVRVKNLYADNLHVGSGTAPILVTDDVTAPDSAIVLVDAIDKGITITLPKITDGMVITFKDVRPSRFIGRPMPSRVNHVAISAADGVGLEGGRTSTGSTYQIAIQGRFIIDTNGGAVTFTYQASPGCWIVTSVLQGQ